MANTRNHITILRIVFFISLVVLAILFIQGKYDYALLVIFLLACGSVINLSTSTISKEMLIISKHFFYGMLRSKTYVALHDIVKIIPISIGLSDSIHSSSDDLVAVLASGFNTTSVDLYEIKWKDKQGVIRKIKISKEQFELLKNRVKKNAFEDLKI